MAKRNPTGKRPRPGNTGGSPSQGAPATPGNQTDKRIPGDSGASAGTGEPGARSSLDAPISRGDPRDPDGPDDRTNPSDSFARVTIPREIDEPERRKQWGLPEDAGKPGRFIIELNLQHVEGLPGAAVALKALCAGVGGGTATKIAKTYYSCQLNLEQVRRLVALDESHAVDAARDTTQSSTPPDARKHRAIFRVWPDFPIKGLIDRSVATIKADAAARAFAAEGTEVVWAVVDSGVEARHRHFGDYDTADAGDREARARHAMLADSVASLHRCYCAVAREERGVPIDGYLPDPEDVQGPPDPAARAARLKARRDAALSDEFGHGTHVAGIIAGGLPSDVQPVVLQREFKVDQEGKKVEKQYALRRVFEPDALRGIARRCKIVSLRVLDRNGAGYTSDVMRALEYIREQINDDPKMLRVHGVNLSVGYEFDAELFACGQSPLCAEVDRLVQAGVVVVAAAGNTGYGQVQSEQRVSKTGLSNTINDPGNAALAITVGSTHRDSPHTYGVSYFSSKGPTGDGRLKPDLVAPGERITSCAAGKKLSEAKLKQPSVGGNELVAYIDDSGTSMAAPHVSGAIASFLSIRREFIGKPLEVKRIFLSSATPLGRERYFEGNGLVDLMRAIQSV
jgi:subtilisin family serine protease